MRLLVLASAVPAFSSLAVAGEGTHWGASLTPYVDFNDVNVTGDSCTDIDREALVFSNFSLRKTNNALRALPADPYGCDRSARPSVRVEGLVRQEIGPLASLRGHAGLGFSNMAGSVSWSPTSSWNCSAQVNNPDAPCTSTGYDATPVTSKGHSSYHVGLNVGVDGLYDFYKRGGTPYLIGGVHVGAGWRTDSLGPRGTNDADRDPSGNDMEYWWTQDAMNQRCQRTSPTNPLVVLDPECPELGNVDSSVLTASVGGRFGVGYRTAAERPLFFELVYTLSTIGGGNPANFEAPANGRTAVMLDPLLLNALGLTAGMEFN